MWVAEDAYITFRVVENLYQGHGLVYNPGERTEAFTHPLWMAALVVLRGTGLPLHAGSVLLGLTLTLAGIFLLLRSSGGFPIAAVSLCAISGFRDFSTAGMEFSPVFFLLVLFFLSASSLKMRDRPFLFSSLLALLYLTRPELGLMTAYYSVFILVESAGEIFRKGRGALAGEIRRLSQWAAGILVFAGTYQLFRWLYYGDLFPNTYYAKSGLSAYYSQGFKYLASTLIWSPSIWIAAAAALCTPVLHRLRKFLPARMLVPYMRELGVTILLVFYVIRVGGDFMAFRFLLPELSMLALLAHRSFSHFPPARFWRKFLVENDTLAIAGNESWWKIFSFAALLFYIVLAFQPIPYSRGFIADERSVFTMQLQAGPLQLAAGQAHPWGLAGADFKKLQQCLELGEIWITNSQTQARCMKGIGLGYFGFSAGAGVKIFDEQGLPNREVARMTVLYRWRPGHEHYVGLTDVLEKNALFCSSGDPQYDRIMATNAGILINLDKDLLLTLPGISSRLQKLLELKRRGNPIVNRLEEKYRTTIESLAAEERRFAGDPVFLKKSQCWSNFPVSPDRYFY